VSLFSFALLLLATVAEAAADRIAPTHDEDGLVKVVEWVMEGLGIRD
jgi:hypothetical protein